MTQDLNHLQKLGALGQSVWYDNMYRALIATGELDRLLSLGVTGLTSNPTIFQKAISSGEDYDDSLAEYASRGLTADQLFEALATEDIQAAADILRPVYEQTGGADGFASLEVSPRLAHDTDATVKAALRLFAALDRPNVMIKVPATPEGIPAIRELIGRGVNINVTLIFSLEMYARVREAYIAGLEDLDRAGGNVGAVASVASFFVSRVDTAVDGLIEQRGGGLVSLMGKAAVANAKIAYQDFTETFGRERFQSLARKGARVQRPLWASTSTKNPEYSDVLYVEAV
ncbi:MAG: transaldolase, partial [Dehalococcoidia bacterium]|nr:transaldolase [Dehalococcoidia bacterium]